MKDKDASPEPSDGEQASVEAAPPADSPPEPPPPPGKSDGRVFVGTGFYWPVLVGVLLTLAILALILQNTQRVVVEWLWLDVEVPLVVLLLVTALVAVVLTELVGWIWRRRRRRALRDREELKRLRG